MKLPPTFNALVRVMTTWQTNLETWNLFLVTHIIINDKLSPNLDQCHEWCECCFSDSYLFCAGCEEARVEKETHETKEVKKMFPGIALYRPISAQTGWQANHLFVRSWRVSPRNCFSQPLCPLEVATPEKLDPLAEVFGSPYLLKRRSSNHWKIKNQSCAKKLTQPIFTQKKKLGNGWACGHDYAPEVLIRCTT